MSYKNLSVPQSAGENNELKNSIAVCQYACMGDAYLPTNKTVPILRSDVYKLFQTPDGKPYFKPQNIVTDELMRLPDSKSDEVIAEIEEFWRLKEIYKTFGFAHKRGFLLHGPAGSGKTSTLSIVMKDMVKKDGVVFIGDYPEILANALRDFRIIEPLRPLVVVLEDIDTIIETYGEADVLSILDGESQVDNVVFIATTNYPEDLDGRIANRPSRFDKVVKIDTPNPEARKMFLESKIPDLVIIEDGETFDLVKETDGFSIAHLKELIIGVYCQKNKVKLVLTRLKNMKRLPKSVNNGIIMGIGE